MESRIKEIFLNLGADLCGIASISRFTDTPAGFHPTDVYVECKSVIVFAKSIPKGTAYVSPRIVYNKANDINAGELDRISFLASIEIEKLGGIAVPIPSDGPYEYWDNEKMEARGIISMKHAAVLAGLGSLGKSTLLLTKKYGNLVSIGAVLTNLDLISDPLSDDLCISGCRLCLDSCPPKALDGKTANQKLCREYAYDTTKRGFSTVNCNKCRVVCPKTLGILDK